MYVIEAASVDEAMYAGLSYLRDAGLKQDSRNGPVLRAPGPVATVYRHPTRRVLYAPERKANPFLHLFEALWIMAGRKDVAFLAQFAARFQNFSDDGVSFHAAYGFRLRHHFGDDQINVVCQMLRENPQTRRAVLQIWDSINDLDRNSKDLPCNDLIFLDVNPFDELSITVCCRSNDAVWGAYGTNVVQFSVLQEYIAAKTGLSVGVYTQISNNFHVYTDLPFWKEWVVGSAVTLPVNPYLPGALPRGLSPYWNPTLIYSPNSFAGVMTDTLDMLACFDGHNREMGYGWMDHFGVDRLERKSEFFQKVACPMLSAYAFYKRGDIRAALHRLELVGGHSDWLSAAYIWLTSRTQGEKA